MGLNASAWVLILQAAATYSAIASAYFFARPVLRIQSAQDSREVLGRVVETKPDAAELVQFATDVLSGVIQAQATKSRRDNFCGMVLLAASLLSFTAAVAIQTEYDPAFSYNRAGSMPRLPVGDRQG